MTGLRNSESLARQLLAAMLVLLSLRMIGAAQAHPPAPPSNTFQSLAAQADAARDAQQLDKAVALYRKALALRPQWAEGWWSLGTIQYDADNYASAAEAFHRVVKLNPKHGTAQAMLGLCEFELGESADALRDIEASKNLGILEDEQLRKVVFYHEGVLLQRAGRFYEAQRALASLCLEGVKTRELAQTLGMTVLRMRDERPPAPGTVDAQIVEHLGRGACLQGEKNYDAARREFESVVAQHPDVRNIHYAYGRFLLDAGDRDAAIGEFEKQIAKDPKDLLSLLLIAATEIRVNDTKGLPYAEEAVRQAPSSPLAHFVLGALLIDAGKDQEAIPHLEQAKAALPTEAKIYWSLATAYARVGRTKEAAQARADFQRIRQQQNDVNGADVNAPLVTEQMTAAPQR